jgi:hypothetical protein
MSAISCSLLGTIQEKVWMDADVLGIDEGQFFDDVSKLEKMNRFGLFLISCIR